MKGHLGLTNKKTREESYRETKLESNEETREQSLYGVTKLESNKETMDESYWETKLESNEETGDEIRRNKAWK